MSVSFIYEKHTKINFPVQAICFPENRQLPNRYRDGHWQKTP